jgi:hypothetical protein
MNILTLFRCHHRGFPSNRRTHQRRAQRLLATPQLESLEDRITPAHMLSAQLSDRVALNLPPAPPVEQSNSNSYTGVNAISGQCSVSAQGQGGPVTVTGTSSSSFGSNVTTNATDGSASATITFSAHLASTAQAGTPFGTTTHLDADLDWNDTFDLVAGAGQRISWV